MQRLVIVFSIFFILILTISCSSDPYKDYVGLWETKSKSLWDGKPETKVMEISQNGESYLASENILTQLSELL